MADGEQDVQAFRPASGADEFAAHNRAWHADRIRFDLSRQAVDRKTNARLVHSIACKLARFGQAEIIWPVLLKDFQHNAVFLRPVIHIPVLCRHNMAVLGAFRHHADAGTFIRSSAVVGSFKAQQL